MATPDTKRPRVDSADAEEPGPQPMDHGYDDIPVQALMEQYYGKLFPAEHMCRWLSYGNDSKHPSADSQFLSRREFCFTLDGDIFVRYKSFKDHQELAAALRKTKPAKIDIGPVYNVDPQRRHAYSGFAPQERELVFDIDMTDYDDVRTCGKEGHICCKCWPLMAAAVQVIDAGLREDFGFEHILWVFSGRRGVHCWVCDKRARQLADHQRAAVAAYFSVYKGQEKDKAKVAIGSSLHPSVQRAYATLRTFWLQEVLPQQQLLADEERWEKVLKYVPDADVVARLRQQWSSGRGASRGGDVNVTRWEELEAAVDVKLGKGKDWALRKCIPEIVFAHCYPRLDVEVSKKMNHLLKAPFCVHPKTGKVCVPIDPEHAAEFDPDTVPTVQHLLAEARQKDGDWKGTQLAEHINYFQTAFLEPLKASTWSEFTEAAAKKRQADTSW